ncbi:hypothetical protein B0T22DRAFT_463435 [Podospora appendiculata]|uniref:Uncharacterized protein n=1 Tax=Podospora appendiculata TaxID=314037 RepID=A0AAE1CEA5_9PEZI|nr:hypothetical protein B0T22DRAFT_463435 [Podospora appendiculata]
MANIMLGAYKLKRPRSPAPPSRGPRKAVKTSGPELKDPSRFCGRVINRRNDNSVDHSEEIIAANDAAARKSTARHLHYVGFTDISTPRIRDAHVIHAGGAIGHLFHRPSLKPGWNGTGEEVVIGRYIEPVINHDLAHGVSILRQLISSETICEPGLRLSPTSTIQELHSTIKSASQSSPTHSRWLGVWMMRATRMLNSPRERASIPSVEMVTSSRTLSWSSSPSPMRLTTFPVLMSSLRSTGFHARRVW